MVFQPINHVFMAHNLVIVRVENAPQVFELKRAAWEVMNDKKYQDGKTKIVIDFSAADLGGISEEEAYEVVTFCEHVINRHPTPQTAIVAGEANKDLLGFIAQTRDPGDVKLFFRIPDAMQWLGVNSVTKTGIDLDVSLH